jgi:hypothetical protein
MGMRADVDALPRDELGRSHLVEEDEWPDHLPFRRRKGAANLETSDVSRSRHDQGLNRVNGDGVGTNRIQRRVPAHIILHPTNFRLRHPAALRQNGVSRTGRL